MNRTWATGLAAAWIVCALAPAALDGQRLDYLGGGAGLTSPAGSFGDVEKAGWHLLVTGVGTLKGSVGFTVDALYGQTTHRDDVSGKSTLAGVTANLVLFLGGETKRIRPFVLGGLGAIRVNVDVPGFGSVAATKLALGGGGGLLVGSGRRRVFLMARHLTVRTSPETTSFMPISVGVSFATGSR